MCGEGSRVWVATGVKHLHHRCAHLTRVGRLFVSCHAGCAVQIRQLWSGKELWGSELVRRNRLGQNVPRATLARVATGVKHLHHRCRHLTRVGRLFVSCHAGCAVQVRQLWSGDEPRGSLLVSRTKRTECAACHPRARGHGLQTPPPPVHTSILCLSKTGLTIENTFSTKV